MVSPVYILLTIKYRVRQKDLPIGKMNIGALLLCIEVPKFHIHKLSTCFFI